METADRSGIVRFYHGNDRFPDNGVAFAASLEDAVATEETRAANEYAEATDENRATAETASAEEDEIEIETEEVMEGSDSMDFTGGEGGVSLVDEADSNIEPYATADEFGEIAADVKEEAAIVEEDISKKLRRRGLIRETIGNMLLVMQ